MKLFFALFQVYSSRDHVMVIEKGSGRVLSDRNAPPLSELEDWLKANPTFCPLLPNKPNKPAVESKGAESAYCVRHFPNLFLTADESVFVSWIRVNKKLNE